MGGGDVCTQEGNKQTMQRGKPCKKKKNPCARDGPPKNHAS